MNGMIRWGKASVVALLCMVAIVIGVGFLGIPQARSASTPQEVTTVLVEPGDTLWAYAQRVAKPGEDVRDVVVELKQLNRLDSSSLQVGQRILLPVDDD